jgi:alpha-glucosidase (family GH31 glycosyl hydrolase)
VANISRNVLAAKYSLLPYYNTLFFQASQRGGTVLRPLFFGAKRDQTI